MAVRRDRPDRSVPGELHTPDGRSVRLKLPPGLLPPGRGDRPAALRDDRSSPPEDDRSSPRRDVGPPGPA